MIKAETITRLVEEHLNGGPVFLVDVNIRTGNRIAVFLDGDQGVTIEVCREVNRFLNENLDREKEDYDLTVSSSGLDRPLKLPRQYRKNLGKSLEIEPISGDKFTGTVMMANDAEIVLEVPPTRKAAKDQGPATISLKFTEIKSAREVIKF